MKNVADCAAGRVMAGEDKELNLADGEGLESWIHSRELFTSCHIGLRLANARI